MHALTIDLAAERARWRQRNGVQPVDHTVWLEPREAARRAGLSMNYISALARRGRVRAEKRNQHWHYDAADLDRYVREQAAARADAGPSRLCIGCGEVYPGTEFGYAGTAFRNGDRGLCNDCYRTRYRDTRRRACTACGDEMYSRKPDDQPAYHRGCDPRRTP